jgi:ribose transport system ATP-binding protein
VSSASALLRGSGDPEPVLRVTGLSKTYATTVVRDVSLTVAPGRIHALLGGNGSGKSTLLKMIAGVVPADPGGTLVVHGHRYASRDYASGDAASHGLRFVHQDLGLVDLLSIAENFALAGGYPRPLWIDDRAIIADTARELARHGLAFDPRMPVGALRPSDRTRVAIARALRGSDEAELTLILDEPTASLPIAEVEALLASLRRLREAGHGIVFVTHRLGEVLAVADDVTILRDGKVAASGPVEEFDEDRILTEIAGHAPDRLSAPAGVAPESPVALAVRGLSAGPLDGIDLDVHRGEIVGVAGLVGSGRTSLLRALFGDLPSQGSVHIAGVPRTLRSPADAVAAGIALVPEDRLREAAFSEFAIWENLAAIPTPAHRRWYGLSSRAQRRAAPAIMRDFRVRADSAASALASLSGGNQQKVILARWMQRAPAILLLDEPTQGVDAVARDEIHRLIRRSVSAGAAAIVVSSDVDELEQLCDTVIVLRNGRLTTRFSGAQVRRETLTAAMQQADDQPGAMP